ncbi:MAG: translocation/assembly module TamB domain-containing protein, partial [Acetobacteraceae bacterium]|nr:translocation/assembly module TamB domain-containing protein [Acetobacteraceae bacterium]
DLSPLLGKPLTGSIDAKLDATSSRARIEVAIQHVSVPGLASLSHATLNATVSDPVSHPVIDGALAADGLSASGIERASLRLTAKGPQDALTVDLSMTAPELGGSAARMIAVATIDAPAKSLLLSKLDASWRDQTLRLLAPSRLAFAQGASIDNLRLGLRQAVLEVNGRADQVLDFTASLRNLPADIATVVSPSFAADGTISADVRLTGTAARPEGNLRLNASGLRLRSGPGESLPSASIIATAALNGTSARLDSRVTAGASHLNVTGSAPLQMSGALDLRAAGMMDLTMLDPILSVQGRRARGRLTLDATVAGSLSAPRIGGTARLANGEVQDLVLGAHITAINATMQAEGDRIRLVQLTGQAGPGSIGGSGTIDIAAPMPVDLVLTAQDARPLASDQMRATIDMRLGVKGELEGNLSVEGTIHVRRADIQIPEKMPSSVAVLPVRRAGAPPPKPAAARPAPDIALNLTLDAPQAVFVRGRGLDAELGGLIHIRGTAANPQPDGGLQLRRGVFSVAGQTLTFTEGEITFTGAGITDPSLHFVANSRSSTMIATLTVSGSAKDPKITLSSVPEMPQDEILAQLLFKQSVSSLSAFQVAEIAAALASFSGATSGIGDPLASLRNTLGLDRLSVGSGRGGAPLLEAGRYLAPGVYVGAKQSATGNGTQASVQIDIAKGLKLETSAGSGSTNALGSSTSGQTASVGLTYQFQY